VAVQYRVLDESAYAAYYRLTDPRNQIQSYVYDVVRSTVPKMELDDSFASKVGCSTLKNYSLRQNKCSTYGTLYCIG
jgi:regulator of protease activity HflC (stomatin/prohibitin superfamily)